MKNKNEVNKSETDSKRVAAVLESKRNGKTEQKKETKTETKKNGEKVLIKKGSFNDKVFRFILSHGELTASAITKRMKLKFVPTRALGELTELGLVLKDKKEKTYKVH